MAGIYGIISNSKLKNKDVKMLTNHIKRRGDHYNTFVYEKKENLTLKNSNIRISKMIKEVKLKQSRFIFGQNSPLLEDIEDFLPLKGENFIILHDSSHKLKLNKKKITLQEITNINYFDQFTDIIFDDFKGSLNGILILFKEKKVVLFSNTGGLYYKIEDNQTLISSERFILAQINQHNITQVKNSIKLLNFYQYDHVDYSTNFNKENSIKEKLTKKEEESEKDMLEYNIPSLKRCTKCILPETFPHIHFNSEGVCNYCINHKEKKTKYNLDYLKELITPYISENGYDCVIPFSGGRDSCFALHIIVKELNLKPVTYTYDWGMVTDLARRNIGMMTAKLGVENIVVSADFHKKREHIKKNLKAWLKRPHLGMLNILTAGDKHFFKYINNIKKETNTKLNIWGFNHLETTHFKTGFLGIKPDFEERKVYSTGFKKQMRYQRKRWKQMFLNPGYFNSSMYDTFSGEYYRSIHKKEDYFELFDYIEWDEKMVNDLICQYEFEKAKDTTTTWRIGDGTAAIFNYVYYTVAGFTEHDTFRSNQIREGQITRDKALELVIEENRPRYENLKWYLDLLDMDYKKVIKRINLIPKIYNE